ncbi:MAG TPA: hypothetical protein VHR38_01580 [Solirubrobacterales bacterium]|nr:hypothetical protein [Solirubrobacterales bacterium]
MSSASPILLPVAASLVALATAVSGCATTQDANKRASIQADRTLASRKPLVLRGTDRDVQVVRTSVVSGKDGSAIVVVLRNRGDAPVNDLPIEVGKRGGDPLNARPNVPYFQSHAPAIAPGAEATWVYVTKEKIGSGPVYARLGAPPAIAPKASDVPELHVSDGGAHSDKGGSSVVAEVSNGTGIPQFGLDVYAVARRGGRYVAAGRASLTHLGVDQSTELTMDLIGDAKGSRIQIYAPPTLFE